MCTHQANWMPLSQKQKPLSQKQKQKCHKKLKRLDQGLDSRGLERGVTSMKKSAVSELCFSHFPTSLLGGSTFFLSHVSSVDQRIQDMNIRSDDDKDTYIHFKTALECDRFLRWYTGSTGHRCCFGKGCKLYDVNNPRMHTIKREYLKRCVDQDNTARPGT